MFESEIAINEFLLDQFTKIASDVPEESLFLPVAGHGHPPVWILGHLAITGESGLRLLGGSITHTEWLRLFGPGSSDKIAANDSFSRSQLSVTIIETYRQFRELAANADPAALARPHGIKVFEGTSIKTAKHVVSVLLTNHFGFHLSQLSACRRSFGHGPLF